jgi:4-amino-4-deoxy-L-arabinose transferase-like glycosyltransferase
VRAVAVRVGTWRGLVAAAVLVGLGIRLADVLSRPHAVAMGDAAEYLGQANLLARGKGFIEPLVYAATHHAQPTAKLPPLYIMLMALCSLVGFKSFLAHRIWSAIIGASAVGLAAVVGRDLAGRRVGLLAAVIVAVYPNIWMSDALGLSETLTPILVLLVLWAAYRLQRRPTPAAAAWLGAAIGLAALGRDELVLLAPLVLLPLAIGSRTRSWTTRGRLLLAGGAACAALLGPWVGYNLTRFTHPVFITDRLGSALATANCDEAWHRNPGYWSFRCVLSAESGVHGDETVLDAAGERRALTYIDDHLGGLPVVEAERLGRTFAVYQIVPQIHLDVFVEGRPKWWAYAGLVMYYALVGLAVPGALLLRRRGTIIYPLLALVADVVITVLLTYGQTRFRAALEPALVLLAAVTMDSVLRSPRGRRPAPIAESDPRSAPVASRVPSDPT